MHGLFFVYAHQEKFDEEDVSATFIVFDFEQIGEDLSVASAEVDKNFILVSIN